MRFWYCAGSTVRTLHVDADPLAPLLERQREALEPRLAQQQLEGERLARSWLVILPSRISQPASFEERDGAARASRGCCREPSVTGSLNSWVKTSSRDLPRSGSRTSSSSFEGRPVAASSELKK